VGRVVLIPRAALEKFLDSSEGGVA
jgi:hypothetical protein